MGIQCQCGRWLANAHATCGTAGEGYAWHMFIADVRGDCSRCGKDVPAMRPDVDRHTPWWDWDNWKWPAEIEAMA